MKTKNITYIDIAKEADVAVGTLSRYFNNGYVSQDKKDRIEKAIAKFGYIPNSSAASIKKGNNFYIVIRTFSSSKSQDLIIEGIISQLGKNILVKYSQTDSKSIIEEVKWSTSLKPKGIICFGSTDIDQSFVDELEKIDSNIVLYGFKTEKLVYTKLAYESSIKELSKNIKEIDFIYDNKKDIETYVSKIDLFKKNKIKVNIMEHVSNTNNYIYFQNRKILLEEMKDVENPEKIIFSYKVDEKIGIFDYAFISDYFFAGICLAKQVQGLMESKDIEVDFYKKNTQ